MSPTKIQWADETWNPLRARRRDGTGKVGWACVRVSPGCVNCYAATQNRSGWAGGTRLDYTVPDLAKVEVYIDEKTLGEPMRWRDPRRVFVCSMTDLFGEWVTVAQIADVFDAMCAVPYKNGEPARDENPHQYLVLTKRAERMRRVLADELPAYVDEHFRGDRALAASMEVGQWPLPNVWVGVSVEDQQRADDRIPHLLATPAAVRFLSCEPLLGPVDLTQWLVWERSPHNALGPTAPALGWCIVGGESGSRARPMDLAWARSLVAQCRAAGVTPFMKQLGSKPVARLTDYTITEYELGDPKGGDMAEWPEDLRVRDWPR